MKNTLNRSSFALGLTIILGCGGCSGDFSEHDEATTQVDGGTSCTPLNKETAGLQVEWVDTGEAKTVQVVNERDVDGALTVTRTTISPNGAKSTELANLVIGANQKLVFEVPALDADESAKTSLHVTAKVEFADGELGWDNVASRRIGDRAIIDAIKNSAIKDSAIADSGTGESALFSGPIMTRAAVTKELCFEYPGSFDVGAGEDFFTEGVPTLRPARGLRLRIYHGLGLEKELILDNYGCTGVRSFNTGARLMIMSTEGAVRGVDFQVKDRPQGDVVQEFSFSGNIASGSTTQTISFDPSGDISAAAFNTAQAVGYVLDRQWSSGAAALTVFVRCSGTSFYGSGKIRLQAGGEERKFEIAHEMGHWAMDQLTDFSSGSSGEHGELTMETQRKALFEGFASFFGAMAFNGTTQSGCFFGSTNCDQGLSSGGSCWDNTKAWSSVMEHCFDSMGWGGHGNETDWARVFWNMRAPNGVGSPTILSWINTANDSTPWTSENLYSLLDARADVIGGTLNSRFDANKFINGVDH